MPVYRVLDEELMSEREFRWNIAAPKGAVSDQEAPAPVVGAFTPIGPGRPLTVQIRHVYTGRFPRKGGLFGGSKDVALVSGVKDFAAFAASSRALNLLSHDVRARTHLKGSAFDEGTPVVLYSPAVMTDSLMLSVELAVDSFPSDFIRSVGQSLRALAGLPLMLPHAGLLLGAGEVARMASDLGGGLFDGRPAFSITEAINFDVPGGRTAQADFRVMTHDTTLAANHRYRDGTGLVDAAGAIYEGDSPYVVISLDGKERPSLAGFAETVASAAVLARFFGMKEGGTASVEILTDGLRLASDMRYRVRADALGEAIGNASGDARDRLVTEREAVLKNILNDILRPASVQTGAAPAFDSPSRPALVEMDLDLADDTHVGGGVLGTATIRVAERFNPHGRNATVKVSVRDGQEVFEGDIVLRRDKVASRGITIDGEHYRWPEATLVWDADADAKELATAAMEHWTQRAGMQFRRRTLADRDYVHFKRLGASWSFVGRQGGMQELSFSDRCTLGSAVHEIGHALGLWHEQSRGDRDRHICIRQDLVARENRHNFDQHVEDGTDQGPYDFGSVMHYSATAFSTTGEPTIVTLAGQPIGQRTGVSAGDVAAIRAIYSDLPVIGAG